MDTPTVPPVITIPPAFVTHVVKAVLCLVPAVGLGVAAGEMAFVDKDLPDPLAQYGIAAGFAVVAVLFALVTARNVRALIVRPELVLTPEGFRLTSWRGVGFLGLFLPQYRMRQYVIAWDDFVQSLYYKHTVNGITMEEELRLTTKPHGLVAFGWDVFRPSVQSIQRTMLDYIDERFRAPKRAAGRLAEFQRRRWVQPLVLTGSNLPAWLVAACLALAAGLVITVCLQKFADDLFGFAALFSVIVAFMATRHWLRAERSRHLALGADGLHLGANPARCRTIPWENIRFVRPHTRGNAYNNKDASIERVEVRLSSGEAVS